MRIRTGFVSNSSTSSFCIYGAVIDALPKNTVKATDVDENDDFDEEEYDEYEVFEERASKLGLEHYDPEGYDAHFVGISWSNIGDDETGAEFKKRVESLVAEFAGKQVECETHEEAYYN